MLLRCRLYSRELTIWSINNKKQSRKYWMLSGSWPPLKMLNRRPRKIEICPLKRKRKVKRARSERPSSISLSRITLNTTKKLLWPSWIIKFRNSPNPSKIDSAYHISYLAIGSFKPSPALKPQRIKRRKSQQGENGSHLSPLKKKTLLPRQIAAV